MLLNTLAIIVAIVLSIASGIISVLGLGAIFSASYWGVICVAAILEMAKVVTAAWLNIHWNEISKKLRIYLTIAVVFLMGITSLGIYGFFSKAHVEQQVVMTTGDSSKIPLIENQINIEKENIKSVDTQINQLNNALSAMTDKGKAADARRAITEASKQRQSLDKLRDEKARYQKRVIELESEKLQLENKKKKNEVEIGPLKYITNWFYDAATTEQLEKSVRILILILVFVFDPLAIALIIAVGHKLDKPKLPSLSKAASIHDRIDKADMKDQVLNLKKLKLG